MPSLLSKYRKKRDSHKSEDNSSAYSGEKSPNRVASNASGKSESADYQRPTGQSPYSSETPREVVSPQKNSHGSHHTSSIQETPVGHFTPNPGAIAPSSNQSPSARNAPGPNGGNGAQNTTQAYRRSPQENPWAEWEIRRACPSPRFGHSANYIAARDGELFIMGGIRDMDILDDIWVIDTNMLTGYQLVTDGAKVGPRVGHASLVLGNAHVVFGGDTKIHETDPLDDNLYLLNTSSLKWTVAQTVRPRPCGRYGHSLSNLGARIYVFGGQVDDMFFDDMWAFDLTTWRSPAAKWVKISPTTPPPPPRTNHTVVTWHDKLYLFGGANGDLWYSDTWVFDPSDRSWTQLECTGYVPAPCQGHAATVVGDVMYVFGGMSSQGQLIDQLFALRLPSLKWYTFQNLGPGPSPRSGHSLTAFDGDKILVWGGTDQTNAAFVLDVSRINYPPEVPVQQEQRHPKAAGDPPAIPAPEVPHQTSVRTTPAARNSMMLSKRGSVILPASPIREQIKSYVSDSDEEQENTYVSAMDLPSKGESSSHPSNPHSGTGLAAGAGAGASAAVAAAAMANHSYEHNPRSPDNVKTGIEDRRIAGGQTKVMQKSLPEFEGDTSLEDELRNMPGGLPSPSMNSPKASGDIETAESKIPRSLPQTNLASIPQETLRAAASGEGGNKEAPTEKYDESAPVSSGGKPGYSGSPEKDLSKNLPSKSSSFKELAKDSTSTPKSTGVSPRSEMSSPEDEARRIQRDSKLDQSSSISSGASQLSSLSENTSSPRRTNQVYFKGAETFSSREFASSSPEKSKLRPSNPESPSSPKFGGYTDLHTQSSTPRYDVRPSRLPETGERTIKSPNGQNGSSREDNHGAATAGLAAAGAAASAAVAGKFGGKQSKLPEKLQENITEHRNVSKDTSLNNVTQKGREIGVSPSEQPKTSLGKPAVLGRPLEEKMENTLPDNLKNANQPLKIEKVSKGAPSLVGAGNLNPGSDIEANKPDSSLMTRNVPESSPKHVSKPIQSGKELQSPVHETPLSPPKPNAPGQMLRTNGLMSPAFLSSKQTDAEATKSPDSVYSADHKQSKKYLDIAPAPQSSLDNSVQQLGPKTTQNEASDKANESTHVKGTPISTKTEVDSRILPRAPQQSVPETGKNELGNDVDKIRQMHAASRQEVLTTKDANIRLQRENDLLQSKYSDANSKIEQLQAAMEGHVSALQAQAQRLQAAESRISELTDENTALQQSVNKNQRSVENAGLVAQVAALTDQWKQFNTKEVSPATDDDRSLKSGELSHYRELYETHRNAAQAAHKDLESAYVDMAKLRSQVSGHENKARDLEAARESHAAQHKDLQQQLLELRRSHEELESEYDRAMEYSQNQQIALTRTREDLNHARINYQRLEEQMQEIKLSTDPDASQGSMGSLNTRHAQLLIRDLRAQIVITEEERDELREQVRKLKKAAIVNQPA